MLTTVQDCGRHGWQHVGVVPSGAMDCDSLKLANALVGNSLDQAGLEISSEPGRGSRFAAVLPARRVRLAANQAPASTQKLARS